MVTGPLEKGPERNFALFEKKMKKMLTLFQENLKFNVLPDGI